MRKGSKHIPQKNIKIFNSKPLFYWACEALVNSGVCDEVWIATDDPLVVENANKFFSNSVRIHILENTTTKDVSTTIGSLVHLLSAIQKDDDDIIILTQATSPLTTADDVRAFVEQYVKGTYVSQVSCVHNTRFFWDADTHLANYDPAHRPRRQDFPGCFMENGALYATRIGKCIAEHNILPAPVGIYKMKEYTGLEIDELHDWIIVETLMKEIQSERISSAS